MLKKILPLFIFVSTLFIIPVYADKEYKFTLNKSLENKEIIYTWENNIENFSFEMVSPSKEVYNDITYNFIEYDSNNNSVSISFEYLEKGQWKVFFRGDSDPVGLKNSIIDYYPISVEFEGNVNEIVEEFSSESELENNKENSNIDVIIIGAEKEEIVTPELTINQVVEEDSQGIEKIEDEVHLTEEELKIIKEKKELSVKRLEERNLAKEAKKEQKEIEKRQEEEIKLEEQRKESEVELVFEEVEKVEETQKINQEIKEQVIILNSDANNSPEIVDIQKKESDVNLINIDANEERAKIQQKIQQENNKIMMNNIIMVIPLISTIILFVLNLITKNKILNKK